MSIRARKMLFDVRNGLVYTPGGKLVSSSCEQPAWGAEGTVGGAWISPVALPAPGSAALMTVTPYRVPHASWLSRPCQSYVSMCVPLIAPPVSPAMKAACVPNGLGHTW